MDHRCRERYYRRDAPEFTGYSYFGALSPNGEFEGDNAIVGDDPNERDPNEHDSEDESDSEESTSGDLKSFEFATGHADMGLPVSSSPDDVGEDAADAD